MLRRVVVFLIAGLVVVPALPALASPEGEIAAALVSEASYRHILDEMLYTHAGDDRDVFGADHDPARTNIYDLFQSYGLNVALEPFDYRKQFTLYNVVATKVGVTDPTVEYVIGAHYDSDGGFEAPPAPGADDNASGVALVLEAARVLSAYQSDYTIRFIAFDAEEWGLWGSEAYVDTHSTDDIRGMISADMVARNNGQNAVEIGGWPVSSPSDIMEAIAEAVAAYGNGLGSVIYEPTYLGSVIDESTSGSDHIPFLEAGLQAAVVSEYDYWNNPNFHTPFDNVDVPNYIDYAYATRVTRSLVGFLVDNAGANVDIPDADYDGDGDVDLDDFDVFSTCYSGSGNPPATGCEFFDFDGDDDVDCVDWELFEAVWTQPGYPPPFLECAPALVRPIAVAEGGRYVLVTPRGHSWPMALLVTGDPDDPGVSCVSRYVRADGRLGTIPVFRTFDEWGTVLVHGEEIVPGASYRVQCDYGEPGSPLPSGPTLPSTTTRWGDTVGPYREGIGWLPPDGSVDVIDVVAILDRFKNLPDAPPLPRADLIGRGLRCIPDVSVDIIDASVCVDAFRGFTYTESTGCSDPCV